MRFVVLLIIVLAVFARTPDEKSGTAAIMKAHSEGRLATLESFELMRPTFPYTYDTPEGNFRVHYDLSGYNAVDSLGYVLKIGQYLEHSWAFFIDSLGYLPPPPDGVEGGDSRYDVYLRDLSAYGQTWPGLDGPQPWIDWTSYIEIENDFDGVYPNDDPEGAVAGAMKITCAHEFHHAIQFGLRGSSGAWIAELSSVYYEDRLYPQVNDYVWLIDYLTSNPEMPLDWESGYHMYGLGLFGQFVGIEHGDGFLVSVWDTMRFITEWPALLAKSAEISHSLGSLYSSFASRAILIGTRDCGYFPDGPALTDMRIENIHNSYPTGGSTANRPYGYGSNYIVFQGFPAEEVDLSVTFSGQQTARWYVNSVWKSGDSVIIHEGLAEDTSGTFLIPLANRADFVALSIVPVGDTRTRYNFNYSASLQPTDVLESQIPSHSALLNAFPNPFNSACTIEGDFPSVDILDLSGRLVANLDLLGGSARWDGKSSFGEPLSSGIYFLRPSGSNSIRVIVLAK